MKNIVHFAIGGVIAAALTLLLKLLLSQQAVLVMHYHYPPFDLVGQAGFEALARFVVFGAAYGILYGLLLRELLPKGLVLGALALACVPTLVDALVLPLRAGLPALKEPWHLLWLFAHWVFYSVVLRFLSGAGGAKGAGKRQDD